MMSRDVSLKGEEVLKSLKSYTKSTGYIAINRQMRAVSNVNDDPLVAEHIANIFHNMEEVWFNTQVRLFRTEANNYTQNVGGKEITSRKISKGDTWFFPSFISAAITNKPNSPKVQDGKMTVFVFEFDKNEHIRGTYLGDKSVGIESECEFLLSPGVAKVKEAYKANIGMGYMIQKTKFVVVNITFTSDNSNIPPLVKA